MQTTPVATTAPHKSKPVTEKEGNGTSVNKALGTKKNEGGFFFPPVWLLKKNRNKLNAKVGGKNGNEKNSVSKEDSHYLLLKMKQLLETLETATKLDVFQDLRSYLPSMRMLPNNTYMFVCPSS